MTSHATTEPTLSSNVRLDMRRWPVSGAAIRRLYLVFVILFALLAAGLLVGYRLTPHPANDFFAFNSYSRFIRTNPPAEIYNQQRLARFQDLPGHKLFAFMYHPGMMLLLWPLAYLSYDLGYIIWIGVGLVACAVAVAGSRQGWPLALVVLVAPTTLWTILCGQSSLLVAALLIGGLRLSPHRSWLGGLMIGLATYKPQLGVLVPIALIAAGRWRTILSASLTAFSLVVVSACAFGLPVWLSWLHHLPSIVNVRTLHTRDWASVLATVASNLAIMGVDRRTADMVQLVALLVTAIVVWWCFRVPIASRSEEQLLPVAALGAATFLATPFAFLYDLPLFTAALLLFTDERRRSGGVFRFQEILVVIVGLLLPWFVLSNGLHGSSSLLVLPLLCTILHRIRVLRAAGRAATA